MSARPRLGSLADIQKMWETSKVKASAAPSTAIVVCDPFGQKPPPSPAEDAEDKAVNTAATMFAGAAIGSQLGGKIDEVFGIRTPGVGSMLLGALGALGGAIMKDSGDPKAGALLTNLGVGAAAAGAVQAAKKMAEDAKPEPLVEMAQATLDYDEEQKKAKRKGKP